MRKWGGGEGGGLGLFDDGREQVGKTLARSGGVSCCNM